MKIQKSLVLFIIITAVFGSLLTGLEGAIVGGFWGVILWYAITKVRHKKRKQPSLSFVDKMSSGMANEFFTTLSLSGFVLLGIFLGSTIAEVIIFLFTGTISEFAFIGAIPGIIWGIKKFMHVKDKHIDKNF